MPPLRLLAPVVLGLGLTAAAHGQDGSTPAPGPAAPGPPPLERFTVISDGHPMTVWVRRPARAHGAILLVHGMTWSTLPDFDLQVPGLQRSVMVSLAARGFAAYGVDLRGYGETPRDPTGWLTPRRSAADVASVLVALAAQHPSLPRPALLGWSRGAAVAAMVAQDSPDLLSALVLFGFASDPEARFVDPVVPDAPPMVRNTAAGARSDFVAPAVTSPEVISAYVEQALKADPIRADLKNDSEFNDIRPGRIHAPTLVMYGSEDAIPDAEAGRFFAALGAADKQLVVLPGGDHAALIEDTHDRWVAAVVSFLQRPPVSR